AAKSFASDSTTSTRCATPAASARSRAAATNSGLCSTLVIRQPNSRASSTAGPPRPPPMSSIRDPSRRPTASPSSRIFSGLVGFWSSWRDSTTPYHTPSAEPSQELVVAHTAPPVGLHLDRNELSVLQPRAPDRDRPPVQLASGADVRREGADPIEQLLRRSVPIELAVLRADLVGVRRALLGL